MLIFTAEGWRPIGPLPIKPRPTTLAALRHERAARQAYADWAREHNAMVNSPNRRTSMQVSALSHYLPVVDVPIL